MMAKNVPTTAVIALFLIISISGVLLLVHAGGFGIKAVHQWLGLAFVLFGLLHSAANWPLMKRYLFGFKGGIIFLVTVATLGLSSIGSTGSQAPPVKAVFATVLHAPLKNVAVLCDREPDALAGQLRAQGYTVTGTDRSIEEIARENETQPDMLLSLVIARSDGGQH